MSQARSDSAFIAATLARLRRRATLVEFRNAFGAWLPAAIVAAEVEILFGSRMLPSARTRWVVALAVIVLASVAACIRAIVRRPSLRETVLAVDRRLGLQDRLVASAQFLGGDDAFAQLIERDAARRLADRDPASVLPVEMLSASIVAMLVALAIPAGLLLASAIRQSSWSLAVGALASRAGLEIAAEAPAVGRVVRATEARSPDRATPVAAAPPPGVELSRPPGAAPRAADPPHRDTLPSRTESERNDGAGSGAGRETARRDGGASQGRAGGVAAGALASGAADTASGRESRIESTAAYRAAWSRAQSAVAPDRIPADERALVARYFAAIRPSESP
jgi:hypothetical protein